MFARRRCSDARALRAAASLGLLMSLICVAHASDDLTQSPTILRIGNWAVHRTQDAMTDATECTGIYNNDYSIQLTAQALLISMPDGVRNVRIRFDDDATESRLPKRTEKAVDAIDIRGGDFSRLQQSKRLRYEVQTAAGSIVNGDVDLNGVPLILGNIRSGCMGDPLPPQVGQLAGGTTATTQECSDGARARMAQKGISAQDIVAICTAP